MSLSTVSRSLTEKNQGFLPFLKLILLMELREKNMKPWNLKVFYKHVMYSMFFYDSCFKVGFLINFTSVYIHCISKCCRKLPGYAASHSKEGSVTTHAGFAASPSASPTNDLAVSVHPVHIWFSSTRHSCKPFQWPTHNISSVVCFKLIIYLSGQLAVGKGMKYE